MTAASHPHTATPTRPSRSAKVDAIALLKADHREVEKLFAAFEKSDSAADKAKLAERICSALTLHTALEEEIFYPAFLEAGGDDDIHHEAIVEHAGAEQLIEQIERSSPQDDYFDAKVHVLSEMIRHHVKEEEKRGGMFTRARQVDLDLRALGDRMRVRKDELQTGS